MMLQGSVAPHFMPSVQGSSEGSACSACEPARVRAAYVAAPCIHHALDALRLTAPDLLQHRRRQAATDAMRAGVLLHEYGDQSTYYFQHLHRQRQQATVITNLQQQQGSPVADLCTMHGRQHHCQLHRS